MSQKTIRISASQVETFRTCQRKWAFQKIDKLPSPQNAAAALGEEAHKHRENWLLRGTPPPADTRAGKLALVGLEHLPPPGLAEVEKTLRVTTKLDTATVDVSGRIDFFLTNNEPQKVWGELGVPLIGDHKTTAGEQWMKTPEVLTGGDPQGAIYARYALEQTGAQEVDLLWAYMIKASSPRAAQVRARMSKGQVDEQYGKVLQDASRMLAIVDQGVYAKDVEPTTTACEAFGGCPYRENCALTYDQKIGAIMAQGNLNDILKLANVQPVQSVQSAPAALPIPTGPALVLSGIGTGVQTPQAAVASVFAAPAPAPALPATAAVVGNGAVNLAMLRAKITEQTTPALAAITAPAPTAPPAVAVVVAAPALEVLTTPPPAVVVQPSPAPVSTEAAPAVVPSDAPAADLAATGEDEKPKRGRPKKTMALETPDMSGALVATLNRIADALEKLAAK